MFYTHRDHRSDEASSSVFRSNALYSSTGVVRGKGVGVVVATGVRTQVGKISESLGDIAEELSPLQVATEKLGGRVIFLISVVLVAFFLAIRFGYGVTEAEGAKFDGNVSITALFKAVNLAIIIIPATLPLTVLLSMKLGVETLAKLGASMRRLTAVETLGSASIICSDIT